MIAEMKKYSFLVFHREYQTFLNELGKLGVVHVNYRKTDEKEETLKDNKLLLERYKKALLILKKALGEEIPVSEKLSQGALEVLEMIESLENETGEIENGLADLQKEIERLKPWGDYELSDLQKLNEAGYRACLYRCTTRQFNPAWQEKWSVFEISRSAGNVYFLLVTKEGELPEIDAEQETPAKKSLSVLLNEKAEKENRLVKVKETLRKLASDAPETLNKGMARVESDIALQTVMLETMKDSGDSLMILEGWVPVDREPDLKKLLEDQNIAGLETVPAEGEMPPILLKNNKFAKLFEPISNLFDLPAYKELDLTPFFAPFFMIFFGFCLGDAGYGVFILLMASLYKLKARSELRPILSLAQYFGVATIIFGMLSGTFFGLNLIDSGYTLTGESFKALAGLNLPESVLSGLRGLEGTYFQNRGDFLAAVEKSLGTELYLAHKVDIIKQAEPGIPLFAKFRHMMQDSLSMFYLSLMLGGVQIIFGIIVKIFNITKRQGFKYALSTLGWSVLLITLVLYALGTFGTGSLTYVFYGLLGISAILIFFLNNPDSNIFARVGLGVWDSYGMVTGLFGDLLSYIRLFALGISSGILGFVFNDISAQFLSIPYVGWFFFLLLLLIGHSINLFLAALGGFIHPMRLTFVEFYKNAGFEGGGKQYKPFIIHH